jgi:hypothetical protein
MMRCVNFATYCEGSHSCGYSLLEVVDLELPLWQTSDYNKFKQNVIESEEDAKSFELKRVGTLKLTVQFKSGIGLIHDSYMNHDQDMREMMEVRDLRDHISLITQL